MRETSSRSSTSRTRCATCRSMIVRSRSRAVDAAQPHQLERGEDRRERVAQLVAEHRQELVLGAVGGLSRLARALTSSVTSKTTRRSPSTAPSGVAQRLIDEVEVTLLRRAVRPAVHDERQRRARRCGSPGRVARSSSSSKMPWLGQLRQRLADGLPTTSPADQREVRRGWRARRRAPVRAGSRSPTGACAKIAAAAAAWCRPRCARIRGAQQLRLDARQQLAGGERLDQVVVGARPPGPRSAPPRRRAPTA